MSSADTIFALATPPGKSGVAVFRLSGTGVLNSLKPLSQAIKDQPRLAQLVTLRQSDSSQVIDQCLVTYFPAPNSFTGEEVVEIACHGSVAVLDELERQLSKQPGLRHAERGEFARRAFLNGKMNLLEVEGLADLIDAETPSQLAVARSQAWGNSGEQVQAWRSLIIRLQAHAEAVLDFSDDLDEDLEAQVRDSARGLAGQIAEVLEQSQQAARVRSGFKVVLTGPPNAGKSSLLNALVNEDLALVSPIPGTTRDSVRARVNLEGLSVEFIDTAGLRESEDTIEQIGVSRARDLVAQADLRLEVRSPSQDFEATESQGLTNPSLKVRTHADQQMRDEPDVHWVSNKTQQGTAELLTAVVQSLSRVEVEGLAFARERQIACARNAGVELELAADAPSLDLVGEHLRLAATHIGRLTGQIDVEDVLDDLFSGFCIGK